MQFSQYREVSGVRKQATKDDVLSPEKESFHALAHGLVERVIHVEYGLRFGIKAHLKVHVKIQGRGSGTLEENGEESRGEMRVTESCPELRRPHRNLYKTDEQRSNLVNPTSTHLSPQAAHMRDSHPTGSKWRRRISITRWPTIAKNGEDGNQYFRRKPTGPNSLVAQARIFQQQCQGAGRVPAQGIVRHLIAILRLRNRPISMSSE